MEHLWLCWMLCFDLLYWWPKCVDRKFVHFDFCNFGCWNRALVLHWWQGSTAPVLLFLLRIHLILKERQEESICCYQCTNETESSYPDKCTNMQKNYSRCNFERRLCAQKGYGYLEAMTRNPTGNGTKGTPKPWLHKQFLNIHPVVKIHQFAISQYSASDTWQASDRKGNLLEKLLLNYYWKSTPVCLLSNQDQVWLIKGRRGRKVIIAWFCGCKPCRKIHQSRSFLVLYLSFRLVNGTST